MGKGIHRQATAAATALVLLLLGCGFKKPSGYSYVLYHGRFYAVSTRGEKSFGKWEAICTNGRITRVYLYNSLGFPLADIQIEGGKVNSSRKIPEELKQLILELSERLPALYEKNKSEIITLEKPALGTLKIKVEGARRVPGP